MQRITQVGVLSLGKVVGASGVLVGLIIGVMYGLGIVVMSLIGGVSGQAGSGGAAAIGIVGGLFVMVLVPVLYGGMSFVFGLIYGLFLNICFNLVGGLEVKIEGNAMSTFD